MIVFLSRADSGTHEGKGKMVFRSRAGWVSHEGKRKSSENLEFFHHLNGIMHITIAIQHITIHAFSKSHWSRSNDFFNVRIPNLGAKQFNISLQYIIYWNHVANELLMLHGDLLG